MNNQKTIKKEVSCFGKGLHTGLNSSLIFKPAPINSGIIFERIDKNNKKIRVKMNNVKDLDRGTSLSNQTISVYSVEHVLSAIYSLDIDNLIISIDNSEVPIFDGSALIFYNLLKKAQVIEQNAYQDEFIVNEAMTFQYENSLIKLYPYNNLKVTYLINYDNQYIGEQKYSFDFSTDNFLTDIAPARTFCLFNDLIKIRERGLLKGATLDSGLVFLSDNISMHDINDIINLFKIKNRIFYSENSTILNDKELRFSNEPVRHKILDLLGDISILGKKIKGHIIAEKSGHKANYEFVKFLNEQAISLKI